MPRSCFPRSTAKTQQRNLEVRPNQGLLRIIGEEVTKIREHAEQIILLDIGCGSGLNSIELTKKLQAFLVGVDNVKNALIQAKKAYPEGDWVLLDADTLSIKRTSVDIILLIFVIHLLKNPTNLLRELYQGLKKPNGLLFIATVDHDQLTSGIYAKYFPEAVGFDLQRFPKVADLRGLLAKLGFKTWVRTQRYFQRVTDKISAQNWIRKAHNRIFSSFDLYTPVELKKKLNYMEKDLTQQVQRKKINLRRKTTIICACPI
ncbi:MAG: class I SAM-dependent methyltransferase [Candidatus Heimdallarchaeota archaeon]